VTLCLRLWMRGFPVRASLFGIGYLCSCTRRLHQRIFPCTSYSFRKARTGSPVQGEPSHVSQGSCSQHSKKFSKASCSSFSHCNMLSMHIQNTALLISKEKSMKHHPLTISHEARTTIADVARWAHELVRLHARISPRFLYRNRIGGSWPTCKAFITINHAGE
jgi:hypothetical protein